MRMSLALLFVMVSTAFGQNAPAGGVAVEAGGKPVARRSTLNLNPGAGTGVVCTDNPRENRVDCSYSYNSAVVPTHETVSANENYCHSANGTTAYTCHLPFKALSGYSIGMTFLLNADATCSTTCTLNIDGLGE